MLDCLKAHHAHSITHHDWLTIVQRTTPCNDCLLFFDQKATGHDLRLWEDELLPRYDYLRDQLGFYG
jgi:hypothetical protein